MISKHKKAIVIGETKLCTQCAERLIDDGWKIIYVISDDKIVIDWAKNNSISVLPTSQLGSIKESNFYLFSIINPCLIPESVLTNKGLLLALNYHDSFLPKYAGVNSTTWAIINNEKQHGVTLHQIKPGIDDGDIVAQSTIYIEKDETAISLNLKCSERLLSLFKETVSKIETETLKFSKQDLDYRTYYGLKHLPDNYGIINGIKDIQTLSRLARGLTFGDGYDNPIATAKVCIRNKFYIVKSFNVGGVAQKNQKSLKNTILFDESSDIYGNEADIKVRYKDILTTYSLDEDELKYLSNIKVRERKYKNQILKFLEEHSDAVTKILDHAPDKISNRRYTKAVNISSYISTTALLALTCFVLARFFRDDFIASLYLSEEKIPENLRNLVENRSYIYIHQGILNDSFANLENHLTQLQNDHYTLAKDFNYRYNIQLLPDIAITVGEVTSTDKHRMVIKIKKHKIEVSGDISCGLQIDNIVKAIATMLSKDIQNEIATKDLKHINLLNRAQYQQIVYDWNKTERDYPRDKTIHELFEEQVLKTPNNIAVVYEDIKLTYEELNQKANQLANYLLTNYKIKSDDLVVLCLDRSEQMIIAMLGVLKSGGAYVPIDPSYPDERIRYILNDTKAKVVLTNAIYKDKLQQLESADVIAIDNKEIQTKLSKQKYINPSTTTTSSNLIYVIYTSGTTGKPKGVLLEHRGIVNFMKYLINFAKLNKKSRGSSYAAFSFDALVTEVYPLLLSGGAVYIINGEDKKDPIKTNDFFNRNHITYAFLPTQFAELFFELQNTSLTDLIVAGDKLNKFVKQKYRVINAYGPTEASVHTTSFIIRKLYGNIPIGKPINNVKCYVMDSNLNMLPVGAVGELMIGGESLAQGYLNLPNLTAEKFVSNPFQTEEEKKQNKNGRLYKTGDLVRLLSDGNLEFIGRSDDQVKIRGFRAELREVESKLLHHLQIKQAVVTAIGEGNSKYLVAYYTSDRELDQSKLYEYMVSQLPDYMIPKLFVYLQKIPVVENGKVNKKALPKPTFFVDSEHVVPKNALEKKVCEIYAQVLNLPIQQVGITDDFFRMGGDSISSIQIVLRIRRLLGLSAEVKDIFNQRTVGQLVENILINKSIQKKSSSKRELEDVGEIVSQKFLDKIRENGEVENIYLANNLQQGFIYHATRYGKTDGAYILQFIWQYKKTIDKNKFKKAWQLAQKKYPSLRLRFAWDSELIQIIDKNQELDFRYVDLSGLRKKEDFEYQTQVKSLIEKDRQEYYDLQKGNLIRIYLIKLPVNNYSCICSVHHIILDGWSLSLLFNYVHDIYSQLLENKQPQITEDIVYKKAQQYLQEYKNENQEYWNGYIKQIEGRMDLRSLLKPSARGVEIKNHTRVEQEQEQRVEITGQKLDKLKDFCQTNAVTINTVIQYAWHKILHIYGASDTTVVGTVVAGRSIPIDNIENSVGLFINTLPLICVHDRELDLIGQIKSIQNSINKINGKSNINLASLQSEGERLFDSLIAYENYPIQKCAASTSIGCGSIQENFKVDYPIAIAVYEKDQNLTIRLKYAGELFSEETIAKLLDKLLFFVKQVSESPHKKTLSYLNQNEYQRFVIDCNKTEKDYPVNKTIHQIFEEQVLKTPNNIALVYEGKKITYEELNNKANQLANYLLKNYNIDSDDLIALILDRSEYMIISILAILKTGAAYVPIDPAFPDERIKYVLEDTKAKIIIKKESSGYKMQDVKIIEIDKGELQQILSKEDTSDPKTNVTPNSLAYVIYTSGTTGKPKGVMIGHKGVVNYITYLIQANKLNHETRGSQYANFSFDATVIEVYPLLLSGGALYVIKDADKLDPIKVNDFFIRNSITYAFLPTSFAEMFFELKNSSLKNLIVGGDKLQKFIPQPYQVINAYGPTETTVQSNYFVVEKQYQNIPIGKPIPNVTNYILDKNLSVLPIGVIGELHIGGEGLARGYLNQPQLTAEKFILNPFQTPEEKEKSKNSKLYKTGDLVRMLPDGNIEHIGRNDFQIKIRGYRIELGEIENKLISYPGIKQSVVTVNGKLNDKYLTAYYVADRKLDKKKIKFYLSSQLPDYMVPRIFVNLQKLPFTENGKLDRQSLPLPAFENKGSYLAPRNKQEKMVCKIFANILGLPKVGVDDDFFLLGGNSILAIKLVSVLQANFDIKISDIFDLRTPAKIAKSSIFGKNFLQHKLEKVRQLYEESRRDNEFIETEIRQDDCLKSIEDLNIDVSLKKPIYNVLLTGSTGYLGCNILNQLLNLTDYKIYLPIRASSQIEAIEKINKKYRFYFDRPLNGFINSRIFIFRADIEQKYLGLTPLEYQNLTAEADSVIHAAALVKHYGEYDKFYSANVAATINLLEFAKSTRQKDFHYISTLGVLNYATILNGIKSSCTEDDLPLTSEISNNVYAQTKLLGEHQVTKYQDLGLNCNIYRVGNLAFMLENYQAQENREDNAFYSWLKCLFTIRCSTEIINTAEISQTDLTAQAIVKIFDKKLISNQTYHVFNPYLFDMTDVFKSKGFKILPIGAFIDLIEQRIKNGSYHDLVLKFLLRQGWLDWQEGQKITNVRISQNKTQYILRKLNFAWVPITTTLVCNYFNSVKLKVGDDMKSNAKIFSELKKIAPLIPTPMSWLDINGVVLGSNDLAFQGAGAITTRERIIGKTPYEFYPKDVADVIMKNIKQVLKEKKVITFEETIVDIETGKTRWWLTTRAPLLDDDETNIVGIVATSVEITDRKEAERLRIETELQKTKLEEQENFKKIVNQAANDTQSPLAVLLVLVQQCIGLTRDKIYETLKTFSAFIPINLYWFDENNAIMGANEYDIKSIGGEFITDYVGKTPYDFFSFEIADGAVKHNNLVMQTGKILSKEEPVKDLKTGEIKYFMVFKAPLYDNNGKIIGLLCTSTDITTEKSAENLKLETETQKAKLQEQEKFRKITDQVVHDIRSPLASLQMIIKSYEKDIPEKARVSLREAAIGIGDIANNLLCKYENDEIKQPSRTEERQPVLLSLALLQLLSEKKHKYKNLPVKFSSDFCQNCNFAFIKAEPSHFKRMMSNLINNAVDAFDEKEGKVNLKLDIDESNIKIMVRDNGKGMSQEVINKIKDNIAVTADKKYGHGIGFVQIRETLQRNNGKLEINSKLGKGTEITLTFPRISPPEWYAKEIKLNRGDTVVVLDDDKSAHGAWKTRFDDCKNDLGLKHFTSGKEAIGFISNFPEKGKIFLLTDYELLKQNLNGINVIEKTGIEHSILVTSHYTNLAVRDLAIKNNIKILPKPLASEVSIVIEGRGAGKQNVCGTKCGNSRAKTISAHRKVDLVLIDDNEMFVDSLVAALESRGKVVDKYYRATEFLDKLSQYAKSTKIFLDIDLQSKINGLELAKRLHKKGYTRLYLLSGKEFRKSEVPDYLTAIIKTDIDRIYELAE